MKHFRWMMKGATLRDWLCLTKFESLRKQSYVLHVDTMSVSHPQSTHESSSPAALPWNVILLLGKYHRKHIFAMNRSPNLSIFMRHVGEFITRLEWQWVFRNSQTSSCLKFRKKPCCKVEPSRLPPDLRVWTCLFKHTVENQVRYSLRKFGTTSREFGNAIPIEVDALKWISTANFLPLPTDKDGGYCNVPKDFIKQAHKDILSKNWYCPILLRREFLYQQACIKYRKIAKFFAEELKDENIRSQLCRSLTGCSSADMPRKLSLTVKTYKPPGSISCRNLHVGGVQPFGGLSAWLASLLREALRPAKHILSSSKQLATYFSERVFPKPFGLLKLDVKDFFMSGSLKDFLRCLKLVPDQHKACAKKAIEFLFQHQFVTSPVFPDELWQVVTGSGMGLIHSSDLCDATFFAACEDKFVNNEKACMKFGILTYLRYRDDILVLYDLMDNRIKGFSKDFSYQSLICTD